MIEAIIAQAISKLTKILFCFNISPEVQQQPTGRMQMIVLKVEAARTTEIRETVAQAIKRATGSEHVIIGRRAGSRLIVTIRDRNSVDLRVLREQHGLKATII